MKKFKDDVFLSSRLLLVAVAGAVSYFAYPKPNLWPVIFLSAAGFFIAIRATTLPRAYLIGFVGGFTFFASQGWWLSQYLGPVPLVALATSQALFVGLGAVVFELLRRQVRTLWAQAFIFAITWTAREWLTTHFPYGGYPWSRLAMSQGYSPLGNWVYFGGLSLLTFVLALVAAYLVLLLPRLLLRETRQCAMTYLAVLLVIVFSIPSAVHQVSSNDKFKIAAIQGNANAGLFAKTYPGEILKNHSDVTEQMVSDGANQGVQLVLWPENASDLNPMYNTDAAGIMSDLVNNKLHTPIAFGTITATQTEIYNSSLLWKPGEGIVDQYDKKRPIPFAEYVPDRDFWNSLAPDLIGLIYRGYAFGTRDNYFEVDSHRFGVLICFEIAVDEVAREIVDSGAVAILSQSNNADFGHSDEAFQQLALARLRNIETGIPVINASTVGPSAIFDAGQTLKVSGAFVPAYLVADVGLKKSDTPAMGIGRYFDMFNLALLGFIALALAARAIWNIDFKRPLASLRARAKGSNA
jgi:apolipoprotein N-acyltransferase